MSRADFEREWPEEYRPDWEALRSAKSENPFGEAALEIFKEMDILTMLAAGLMPSEPMSRDDGILCGLLVKACKLGKGIVIMTARLGADRQLALIRELIEELAILGYLLSDTGDGGRFEAYVLNSSVAERELLKSLKQDVTDRGAELPIVASMTRSIHKTTAAAGVDDPSTVPGKKRIGWPSAETLVKDIGGDIYLAYRTGSSVLHSQWSDIYRNHVVHTENGYFEPNFEESVSSPQPLYAGATLLLIAVKRYLTKMRPESVWVFAARLDTMEARLRQLSQMYSAWREADRTPAPGQQADGSTPADA
jgi:Family of unknown function (DUF5677)